MSIYNPISPTSPNEFQSKLTSAEIPSVMNKQFKNIYTPGDVTPWIDLCRTSRQPQLLWLVDYIEPRSSLKEVNDLIRQSEIILYGNKTNTVLKDGYSADINQEIAFHTIRMRLRGEENDIAGALNILENVLSTYFDKISTIRKSNLLVHATTMYLCCGIFDKSYESFNKHWILLKYLNNADRFEMGIWDNEVVIQLVYWFFLKHDLDFRHYYVLQLKLKSANELWRHKKISLLNFMDYDHSWVVAHCGLSFYNHARTIMKNLPPYEKRPSTPENRFYYVSSEYIDEKSKENNLTGWKKYYYEQYNKENESGHLLDIDISDNYLHSYYHFSNDYDIENKNKEVLLQFLHKHLPIEEYHNIVELGCGTSPVSIPGKLITAIDVSEHVCNLLREKGINHIHQSAFAHMTQTQQNYDLCFSEDMFPHMNKYRVENLLQKISEKCKYLCSSIDTNPDFRENILIRDKSKTINTHKTNWTVDEWKNAIEKNFVIKSEITTQKKLYVLCSRK